MVAGAEAAVLEVESAGADESAVARLMVQLGMLFGLLYVAFLGFWFVARRRPGIVRHRDREPAGLPREPARPRRIQAHAVEDAMELRWPIRVRSLSMREFEAAPAGVVTVEREPVQSRGARDHAGSERRVDPTSVRPARGRAPRGANRAAVLRTVGARAGVTLRELEMATGVNGSSLPKLVRTLTLRGELERIVRPDGQIGFVLARPPARRGEEPHGEGPE